MTEKFNTSAAVISQEEITAGIYSLWLQAKEISQTAKAGQFVSVYTKDAGKLLPRPISICEADPQAGQIRLVYRVTGQDTGTAQFAALCKGDTISVLGPLGNGFPCMEKRALLIAGGIGIPPMLGLAKSLICEKQIVMGYKDALFLTEELKAQGSLYIATEDGSCGVKGNVMDAISAMREDALCADVIYACGPKPMLRAVKEFAADAGIECYLSMEERMACGIGACLACVCQSAETDAHTNVKNKRICKDGPVFLASEVVL